MPERRALPYPAFSRGCFLGLTVLACSGGTEGPRAEHRADVRQTDSLVLTTATGAEVWFTLARPATGRNGEQCIERGLEIRGQGKRTKVPLLYTGAVPQLVNDTMMRAMLWKDCTPGVPYLVNLRTGQPVPERGANKL